MLEYLLWHNQTTTGMRTHWPASQFSTRDKLVGAENKQGNDTEIKQTIYFKTKQTININKPAPLAYGCGVVWHESCAAKTEEE